MDSKPDILGITETKLNEFSISNLDLNNYKLFPSDLKTNAGGTALYISINKYFKAIPHYDTGFHIVLKSAAIFGIKATLKRESKWLRFV